MVDVLLLILAWVTDSSVICDCDTRTSLRCAASVCVRQSKLSLFCNTRRSCSNSLQNDNVWTKKFNGFRSYAVEGTAADYVWPISDTNSVLCTLTVRTGLQSLWNTSLARAGLPNMHSVHMHSRPHHRGGPTTMANMKNCYGRIFRNWQPHSAYCFKSFSLCILVQLGMERGMVELASPLGTRRHVFPRFGLMGMPITLSPPKMEWWCGLLLLRFRFRFRFRFIEHCSQTAKNQEHK